MKPLRVAVIGTGHLGRIHARIAAGLDDIELVAVVDPVESSRTSVAQETGTRAVADYRELIGQIDAAIIATPTTYHHAVGMDLLGLGLPLLIEKPIALTSAQATDLVNLAEKKRLALQVGHVERFNPALTAVAPDVRDPKYIEAHRTSGYSFRSTDIGVVMDIMIHDIDVVLSLAKSHVVHVDALGISVLGGHEDMATARLTIRQRLRCPNLRLARELPADAARCRSSPRAAARRSISLRTKPASSNQAKKCLRRDFRADKLNADERAYWKEHVFDQLIVRTARDSKPINAIEEEQRDFVSAVRTGQSPRVDGAAGRDALAVCEMIVERISEHAWDGTPTGRRGAFAMPALPIIAGTTAAEPQERRRAG